MSPSHEHIESKILAKTKSISSAEPNYFLHFEMRYPVLWAFCPNIYCDVYLISIFLAETDNQVEVKAFQLTSFASLHSSMVGGGVANFSLTLE